MVRSMKCLILFVLVTGCMSQPTRFNSIFKSYDSYLSSAPYGQTYYSNRSGDQRALVIIADKNGYLRKNPSFPIVNTLESLGYSTNLHYIRSGQQLREILRSYPPQTIDALIFREYKNVKTSLQSGKKALLDYLAHMGNQADFALMQEGALIKVDSSSISEKTGKYEKVTRHRSLLEIYPALRTRMYSPRRTVKTRALQGPRAKSWFSMTISITQPFRSYGSNAKIKNTSTPQPSSP